MKLLFTALLGLALISGPSLSASEKSGGCSMMSACQATGTETAEVTTKPLTAPQEADVGGCKCGPGCECGVKPGEHCPCGESCKCCSSLSQ